MKKTTTLFVLAALLTGCISREGMRGSIGRLVTIQNKTDYPYELYIVTDDGIRTNSIAPAETFSTEQPWADMSSLAIVMVPKGKPGQVQALHVRSENSNIVSTPAEVKYTILPH